MVAVLHGAGEPLRDGEPTSLELARTPALDTLARQGERTRLRTIEKAPRPLAAAVAHLPETTPRPATAGAAP